MSAIVNKREVMLELLNNKSPQEYIPAAFFIHFEESFRLGAAAVKKHLDYFRYTGMDFVKIQYERTFPRMAEIKKPEDWGKMPLYPLDFYQPQLEVVKGLVKAVKKEALILVTLYSPFMCANQSVTPQVAGSHLLENPEAVKKGLEIITDSLMGFVKECIRLGVDGFYTSTQGGETDRFQDPRIFTDYIRPYDLVLMNEINRSCLFNILHVCDYHGPYDNFDPFLDYPGHLVNCNPQLKTGRMAWQKITQMFHRPCMGGLDRHGSIVSGEKGEIEKAVNEELRQASHPFVLGADCTLPGEIPWLNIRTAIAAAHAFQES